MYRKLVDRMECWFLIIFLAQLLGVQAGSMKSSNNMTWQERSHNLHVALKLWSLTLNLFRNKLESVIYCGSRARAGTCTLRIVFSEECSSVHCTYVTISFDCSSVATENILHRNDPVMFYMYVHSYPWCRAWWSRFIELWQAAWARLWHSPRLVDQGLATTGRHKLHVRPPFLDGWYGVHPQLENESQLLPQRIHSFNAEAILSPVKWSSYASSWLRPSLSYTDNKVAHHWIWSSHRFSLCSSDWKGTKLGQITLPPGAVL